MIRTAGDDSLKNAASCGGVSLRFWSQALFIIHCEVKSSGKDEREAFSIRMLCQ